MKFSKLESLLLMAIAGAYVLWCAGFIYRSSFVTIDGDRCFCLFDDAMISMRYAANFVAGQGLTWNPQERVQGYSNLLMTLFMSLAVLIFGRMNAILAIQLAGIVCNLVIAYLAVQVSGFIPLRAANGSRPLVRVLTFFGALAYYPLAYWSLVGMETGLLTCLQLLSIVSALQYTSSRKSKNLVLHAVAQGLAYMTRNDSLIFAICIWGYLLFDVAIRSVERAERFREALKILGAVALVAIFVSGQGAFQVLYYGEWFPNTYTLRLHGMPLAPRIWDGLAFVQPFVQSASLILGICCVDLWRNFQRTKLLLFCLILSAIGYQIWVGGDPWSLWRMVMPAMPLAVVLFVIATANFANVLSRPTLRRLTVIGVVLTGLIVANWSFARDIVFRTLPFQTAANERNVNTAIAIRELTTKEATVGVTWAGALPYFSERVGVDFLGKCDRQIARLPPDLSGSVSWGGMKSVPAHNRYDLNYSIKTLRPTFVEGFHYGKHDLRDWAKNHYVTVHYRGLKLALLKDSPCVRWDKVSPPPN